jgi:hypothetical protein
MNLLEQFQKIEGLIPDTGGITEIQQGLTNIRRYIQDIPKTSQTQEFVHPMDSMQENQKIARLIQDVLLMVKLHQLLMYNLERVLKTENLCLEKGIL